MTTPEQIFEGLNKLQRDGKIEHWSRDELPNGEWELNITPAKGWERTAIELATKHFGDPIVEEY